MGHIPNFHTVTKHEKNALADIKILLVEDEELISRMYLRRFEQAGATVTIAFDGLQAISLIDESTPDVILLDLMMPKVNGFEFLKSVRGTEKYSKIPVIIVSNLKDGPDDIQQLADLGISDFLTKSDTPLEDLIERIIVHTRNKS